MRGPATPPKRMVGSSSRSAATSEAPRRSPEASPATIAILGDRAAAAMSAHDASPGHGEKVDPQAQLRQCIDLTRQLLPRLLQREPGLVERLVGAAQTVDRR